MTNLNPDGRLPNSNIRVIFDDLWLCFDCMIYLQNDDLTHLDYHYEPEQAETRMAEIQAGVDWLHDGNCWPVSNSCDEHGHDDFSRSPCDCCNSPLHGERWRYSLLASMEVPAS